MTREEILNMPAGRELDALVAEKVMGWINPRTSGTGRFRMTPPINSGYRHGQRPPHYSTDIAAAMPVLEKLAATGRWYMETNRNKDGLKYWWVMYDGGDPEHTFDYVYECASLPEAICKVALMFKLGTEND